jgi:hypothetical protein
MAAIRGKGTACALIFTDRNLLTRREWCAEVRIAVPQVVFSNVDQYSFCGELRRLGRNGGILRRDGGTYRTSGKNHPHPGPIDLTWNGPLMGTWIENSSVADWEVEVWALANSGDRYGLKKTLYKGHPSGTPAVIHEP